jgi:hypothetical protein
MEIREAERRDAMDLLRLNVELHEYSAQGIASRLRIADRYDDESRRSYMDEVSQFDTATHRVAMDGQGTIGYAEIHPQELQQDAWASGVLLPESSVNDKKPCRIRHLFGGSFRALALSSCSVVHR